MTAPALAIAVPLVLGVLLGSSSHGGLPWVASVLVTIWLLAAAALWWSARTGGRGRAILVFALVGAGCLAAGAQLGSNARRAAERPALLEWYQQQNRSERP